MNNYKIGYIVKMFPRLSETFILNEIVELEKLGIKLHIFSSKYSTEAIKHQKVKDVNAQVTYLPEEIGCEKFRILKAFVTVFIKYPRGTLRAFIQVLRIKISKSDSKSLKRFFQSCCIIDQLADINHLHAHFATVPTRLVSLVNKITGMPYSISTHAKDIYLDNRLENRSTIRKFKAAKFIIANSNTTKQDLIKAMGVKHKNKVFPVYNGIDLEKFDYNPSHNDNRLILSVGRLEDKKGFDLLIKSCKQLVDKGINIECRIVGEGSREAFLENLIEKLGLKEHVKLLGVLCQDELIKLYNISTIFVLPCRVLDNGDRDIIPNVLKESMAIGVPVITTNIPAMKEIVDNNQSGILVPPEDSHTLANSIERLLNDKDLRNKLSVAGRKVIEDIFNVKININQLSNLLVNNHNNSYDTSRLIIEDKKLERDLNNAA